MDKRQSALHEGRLRPARRDLEAAVDREVPDLLAPELSVLFCGINPGLYSAAVGHHFARPGNRFWPALYRAGFTERLYSPWEEEKLLLHHPIGVTNLVARATRGASDLTARELREGAEKLRRKVLRYRPRAVAVLGIGAYRTAFDDPRAAVGPQPHSIGRTAVWVLPSPSGANAYYQPPVLVACMEALRRSLAT
ncbi:G/U mismatch-specific DNA glycosylase [Thiohalomonas denitrificans]|uniref:G/U mismatch-specific uracil-DNA glycosylase n=1 Tax=Thiohalomonas denitrificans TaxID=415747 RepID=A0A1G5PVQ4_9GAMM|nr:G/U mismatch-specific DNA glycosylase [Thiohalomonas denitrificans]SCZ53488.1 G/U mismatch-specific uracil-DNA glycosylase [Thiohalomonas denitrificans]